jgi:hypothetical protein
MEARVNQAALEFVGGAAPDWSADLDAFRARLLEHPWGGESADRVVVAADLGAALAEWMTSADWQRDSAAFAAYDASALEVGGKAFVARDGRWTVAVGATAEKELFLMLVGHELIEAAIERRQLLAGQRWDGVSPEAMAHTIWSEYVVERVRTEIGRELGFRPSSQEAQRALMRTLAATAKPALTAGFIRAQDWLDLMLMWARVVGRVDGGHDAEAADVEAFYAHPVMQAVAPLWRELASVLREVFGSAGTPSPELDKKVVAAAQPVLTTRPRPPSTK